MVANEERMAEENDDELANDQDREQADGEQEQQQQQQLQLLLPRIENIKTLFVFQKKIKNVSDFNNAFF